MEVLKELNTTNLVPTLKFRGKRPGHQDWFTGYSISYDAYDVYIQNNYVEEVQQ